MPTDVPLFVIALEFARQLLQSRAGPDAGLGAGVNAEVTPSAVTSPLHPGQP